MMAFNKRGKTLKERAVTTHYFLGWPPWTCLIKPSRCVWSLRRHKQWKSQLKLHVWAWLSPVSDKMRIVGLWDEAMWEKKEKKRHTWVEFERWVAPMPLAPCFSVCRVDVFEPKTRTHGGTLQHRFNLAQCLCGSSVGGYIYIKWSY